MTEKKNDPRTYETKCGSCEKVHEVTEADFKTPERRGVMVWTRGYTCPLTKDVILVSGHIGDRNGD